MILVLIPLAFIIYEDFKYRAIHWWWLVFITLLGIYGMQISLKSVCYNILFIISQILIINTYFSIKHKEIINITNTYLGLGDILFFISIAFYFMPVDYIHFHIYALVFTLLISSISIYTQPLNGKLKTIPLAGYMSIFFCLYLILKSLKLYDIISEWKLIK